MPEPQDIAALREARKHGTDWPGEPTDEFVVHAFAEGARALWPNSCDPGWHFTFRRWLERRDAPLLSEAAEGRALRAAVEALAEEWEADEVDCGSCSQRESHARQLRALVTT